MRLRIGPWSPFAGMYLIVIAATLAYKSSWNPRQEYDEQDDNTISMSSNWWYYNMAIFFWMTYVSCTVVGGPASWYAWATFSMWSWSMVMLRHGLAAMYPFFPSNVILANLLRWTHLPSLTMATIVVGMWNFVIGPCIYFFFMNTPEKKRKFLGYFTSFRLTQIHVFLILYAVLNSRSTGETMRFEFRDLWTTMAITFSYMLFYLLILDRIGVHLYPIFSPRTHWCVVIWSAVWFLHFAIYWMWNRLLFDKR